MGDICIFKQLFLNCSQLIVSKKSKVFALREAVVVHHHRVRRHVLGVGVPHQPSVAYGSVHVHLSKLYIDFYPDIILILS